MSYYVPTKPPTGYYPIKHRCKKCGMDRSKEMYRQTCSNCGHEEVDIEYKKIVVSEYDPNVKDLGDFADELGWDCYKDSEDNIS